MPDLEPALFGFVGALVGSVTSLLGVYLNQRAQGKRGESDFVRAQHIAKLGRQERAIEQFRQSTIAADAGTISDQELHATVLLVRFAFGKLYEDKALEALGRLQKAKLADCVVDGLEAAGLGVVVAKAMAAMFEQTQEQLAPSLRVVAASPEAVAGEHPIHTGAIGQGDEVLGSVQGKDGSEDARRAQRELAGAGGRAAPANPLEVAA